MHVVWVQVPEKHAFMIKNCQKPHVQCKLRETKIIYLFHCPVLFIKEITLLFCKLSSVL